MTLEEIYDRAVVAASMKQARFAAHVGDRIWWVDPQNGVAQLFTRDRQPTSDPLPIKILGTEGGGEWLWAWGNTLNFPLPGSRAFSKQLCERGASLGAVEFTEPRLSVDSLVCAKTFATIALATPLASGYVLHRAGPLTAAFVVDETFVTPGDTDLVTIGKAIGDVLSGGPYSKALDVVVGAFDAFGIPYETHGETVRAGDAFGGSITISVEGGSFHIRVPGPNPSN